MGSHLSRPSATWALPSSSPWWLIYILVVWPVRHFRVPLVIMAPIPLTLIGIIPATSLFQLAGGEFTATSMIGWIALAGIIVRNSILLVDFVRHLEDGKTPLKEVLLHAGAIRFKPILLTALAAMIGAAVILTDPIFQGLAISLLFGLASSTALTVLVIPRNLCRPARSRTGCQSKEARNLLTPQEPDRRYTADGPRERKPPTTPMKWFRTAFTKHPKS
jgi:Cu/Ag efflux pump CusA